MLALTKSLETQLRAANPVSLYTTRGMLKDLDLLKDITFETSDQIRVAPPVAFARRSRRHRIVAAMVAVIGVAAAVIASPALGLLRDRLPFFGAPAAPRAVQLEFASLDRGAPEGMRPSAIEDQTRRVESAVFAGTRHTLWVAPTTAGGFCFEWTDGWGGCNPNGASRVGWSGELVAPDGSHEPKIDLSRGAAALDPADVAAVNKARALAVPRWLSGYVSVPSTQTLEIRFTNGTVAHPALTWVSEPINAGFFSYDVPAERRTAAVHVETVVALDANGRVVGEQTLTP